jgi:DNA helicase HerA-like ATPase
LADPDTYPRAKVLVIDPHGEYGSAFQGKSRVFRINDPEHPLLLPYWALSFDELAWFLVDRRSATETAQDGRLRELVYEARKHGAEQLPIPNLADEITPDSPVPFDIRSIWYALDRAERLTWADQARTKEALVEEGSAATLTSASFQPAGAGTMLPHKNNVIPPMAAYASRMLTRLRDKRFSFMLAPGMYDGAALDLDDLVSSWLDHEFGVTVLDLAGVPSEITDLVVGLVTRVLFETMFWGRDLKGVGRQRPLLVVFEEAHAYLPRGEGQFLQGYARRSVQRLLKEGRKYGIGAAIVSQRPSEIDETILSQCGTFFALRLTNGQDQGRIASMMPDEVEGITNLLPALRTGEALVVGEAVPIPSRVRVRLVTPRPDSMDPAVAETWSAPREEAPEIEQAVLNWRRQHK